jgi:PTS system beta-glucosides-specific IIC component
MAKQLDFDSMASKIVAALGGKGNLSNVNHCATRLRVVVKDTSKVDQKELSKIDGVLGVEVRDENVQVIVGQIIEDLFIAVNKVVGQVGDGSTAPKKKKNLLEKFGGFLMMMAGVMSPIIPALIAAGFITCLLLLLNLCGLSTDNSTYVILNNLAQTVFYFLPVFVAYTSAKKFDTEPVLAMVLACWLLYPDWVSMASAGGFTTYFGIPAMLTTYNGAVLQIILSVWVMSYIDKWLKKVLPISIRHFMKPFLLLIIISVITLTATGPLGGLITNYIAAFINAVRTTVPWLTVPAIILFSMTLGVFVPGFHLALIPIATTSLASVGYDDVINIWFFCCTITPGFIALACALKTKKKALKDIAFPAALSALFGGISEPTTYGITYKMPKIYMCSAATSLITSVYCGLVGLKCYGFGGYSLTNILLYMGSNKDMANFAKALIGVAIMAVLSFVTVWLTKWDDSCYVEEDEGLADVEVTAPAHGTIIEQSQIADPAFANGTLGSCFGVKPTSDEILAPVSGKINSVDPTKHAITIEGDTGANIMIHIGLDSTKLAGDEIDVIVKAGDHVKLGQQVAKIDRALFESKGIDDTIVTILLNSKDYNKVTLNKEKAELLGVA